jgi:hypothetical protein
MTIAAEPIIDCIQAGVEAFALEQFGVFPHLDHASMI